MWNKTILFFEFNWRVCLRTYSITIIGKHCWCKGKHAGQWNIHI